MRNSGILVALTVVGFLLTACGSSGAGGAGTTVTAVHTVVDEQTVTRQNTSTPTSAHTTAEPTDGGVGTTPVSTGGDSWIMPNEVGKGLQAAQDDIQALTDDGIFFTDSSDATGAGRMQILDRDWKVCSQNVAPGTKITASTDINFAAVKLGESCP